jgi:S-formylglutathione hydrolase FrmB
MDIDVIIPGVTSTEAEEKGVSHKVRYKYPVLYLLHGSCNDYSTWERYTSIERYAEERRIAIVTFSAENNMYVNLSNVRKAEKNEWIKDPDYEKLLIDEIPDFVTSMFPITTDPDNTYIAGLSMGGYGALCNGFRNPEKFRAVGAFSPLPTIAERKGSEYIVSEEHENYEPISIIKTAISSGVKLPALYYCYGTEDFLKDKQDWFAASLDKEKIKNKLDYKKEVLNGYGHEWAFWDIEVRKFLDWIPRTDEYYKEQPIRRI